MAQKTDGVAASPARGPQRAEVPYELAMLAVLGLLMAVVGTLAPRFLQPDDLFQIARNFAFIAAAGVGEAADLFVSLGAGFVGPVPAPVIYMIVGDATLGRGPHHGPQTGAQRRSPAGGRHHRGRAPRAHHRWGSATRSPRAGRLTLTRR